MKGEKQPLIAWDKRSRTIATEYGLISYEQFCYKERQRIGRKTKVETRKDNKICVMD